MSYDIERELRIEERLEHESLCSDCAQKLTCMNDLPRSILQEEWMRELRRERASSLCMATSYPSVRVDLKALRKKEVT